MAVPVPRSRAGGLLAVAVLDGRLPTPEPGTGCFLCVTVLYGDDIPWGGRSLEEGRVSLSQGVVSKLLEEFKKKK